MNRSKLAIVLIFVALVSCRDENLPNRSNTRIEASNDFAVSSITAGSDGAIWCLGWKEDELIANKYNSSFSLLKTINLTETRGIDKTVVMQPDMRGGWLIARLFEESFYMRVEVTILDEEFEEIKSNIPVQVLKTLDPRLVSVVALEGGDYVLNYNRYFARENQDIVVRLDKNLEPRWEVNLATSNQIMSHFTENNEGQIQFASILSQKEGISPTGSRLLYLNPITNLRVGLIDSEGQILFDSLLLVESHHTSPIGISQTDKDFIFNFVTNDEHIQQYVSMSFDGTRSNQVQLGFNYINHQIFEGFAFGHFPLGPANPLPRILKPGQGHLIYSEVDEKLQYLEVGNHPELVWKFPINLPEFDELLSYRQLFTDDETIIIGVNFKYLGKEYFNLQEVSMDGEVL